jgi:uncharacterized protein with HEPN domain
MPREDLVRIQHMIEAAEAAQRFIAGRQRVDLDTDEVLLFALVRAVEIIGEAASNVSRATRDFRKLGTVAGHRLNAQPADPRMFRYRTGNRLEDGN